MHNHWIAAFEHAGIWTREQAEHVSNELRNTIHREKYSEAYEELGSILKKGEFKGLPVVTKLEAAVEDLQTNAAPDPSIPKITK